jgi:hypothetical protein
MYIDFAVAMYFDFDIVAAAFGDREKLMSLTFASSAWQVPKSAAADDNPVD